MIAERVLLSLEFDKIRQRLADFAVSDLGKGLCLSLKPTNNLEDINKFLNETDESSIVISYTGSNPMVSFIDVSGQVSLAQKGAMLSQRALLNIAFSLRAARAMNRVLITDGNNTPQLSTYASKLTLLVALEQNISESIISDEEIADNASTELANIRRKIRHANARVKEKLNSIIKSPNFQKYLQEPIITIRQDRFVIPVKLEYRANVPGLIHDQSSSGATLFIEPMAIVEINNDIKQLIGEEKQEISRILQSFSDEIGVYASQITDNIRLLTKLDFSFAKASYAKSIYACMPKINTNGYINIIKGRHPLLNVETVVPCDLWLGDSFTTLVITGPNTGGKTVTLKTVGLFTLMMQAGLHVPADYGTELAVFDNVFADIGDEQSIEQSLSTFSSHMKNIVEILNNVMPNDLVLFDELGAGTDPTEGAALAQSILSNLLKMKIRCIATTHYSELKAFALSTKGIENGSVEFNIDTLSPTFRLSIGIPGKSNAFEISKKLGLNELIINDAKDLLSSNTIKFEDVIANAEYHRQVAQKEREIAQSIRAEAIRLREESNAILKDTESKKISAIKKAKEEAKRIVLDAKNQSEKLISELKALKKGANTQGMGLNQYQKAFEESIDSLSEGLPQAILEQFTPPESISIGDRVLLTHLNTEAEVLSLPDAKNELMLLAGSMKLKANLNQLKKLDTIKNTKKLTINTIKSSSSVSSLPLEVDVRGMALDEAEVEVDAYLYKAHMLGYKEVFIIHGKGTGVLKTGIAKHLKAQKHVKAFRLGRYGEGEDGVTVVSLK